MKGGKTAKEISKEGGCIYGLLESKTVPVTVHPYSFDYNQWKKAPEREFDERIHIMASGQARGTTGRKQRFENGKTVAFISAFL